MATAVLSTPPASARDSRDGSLPELLARLARSVAEHARRLRLVTDETGLELRGAVTEGGTVEWYDDGPRPALDFVGRLQRPGCCAVRIDCDDLVGLHLVRGDVLVVDERGELQAMVRDFSRTRGAGRGAGRGATRGARR